MNRRELLAAFFVAPLVAMWPKKTPVLTELYQSDLFLWPYETPDGKSLFICHPDNRHMVEDLRDDWDVSVIDNPMMTGDYHAID